MYGCIFSLAIVAAVGLTAPALAADRASPLGTYNPDGGSVVLVDDDFDIDVRIGTDRPRGWRHYSYDGPRYYRNYGYGGTGGYDRYYEYNFDRAPRRYYYNPNYNWRTDDGEFRTWYGGRIKEGEIEFDDGEIEFDDGKIEFDD